MTATCTLLARRLAAALALSLLVACGTPVRNPVSGETERSVMDEKAELALGAKAHADVLKEYGVLGNPALQAYVDGIGQKLAAQSHRSHLKWTFTVLDSPEVNAFALPGGYVYITRGIMAYLDSEADLAGVLGHEIGHVTARHGAQRATAQQRAGLGVLAATILGVVVEAASGVGGAAQAASQISQGLAAGHIAKYGREQELQADQLGAEYLARTHYNPNNMVDVIRVLQDQERYAADAAKAAGRDAPSGGGWLASHPSSEQRLAEISGTATRLAASAGRRSWDEDGRLRYLRAIEGVGFGDGREQGVVRGRNFFHEPLGIALTAPSGWRIVNDSEQLVLVNAQRDAALAMRLIPAAVVQKTGNAHESILRGALGAVDGRSERLTLGGSLQATHFVGTRRDSRGQSGPLVATLVNGPGEQIFLLTWNGRDNAALQRASGALREAELSFRALSASDRAAARPWRLKLVPYPAGGFAQLAQRSPLAELPEAQLRLLNNAYGGTGGPQPGQWVKVVE